MNLNDVIIRVRRTFGDEADVQISDDDVIRWVNDAQRDIAINTGLLETKATSVVSASTGVVEFPDNLLTLHAASVISGTDDSPVETPLKFLTFTEFQQVSQPQASETYPLFYTNFGRSVYLYPIPSDDVTLILFYTRTPVDVSNGNDIIDLPINYHSRVVEYCMKQAYELDENFEASVMKTSEYEKNLSTQQNQESQGNQATYPVLTIRPEDY
jgi:hypothetical protein